MSTPDAGTPTERTELAWQRTALSLVAGSAVITRLTFGRLGTLALTALVVALPLSLWVLLESRLRYRQGTGTGTGPPVRSRDGVPAAALALGTVAVAAVELAALLRPR